MFKKPWIVLAIVSICVILACAVSDWVISGSLVVPYNGFKLYNSGKTRTLSVSAYDTFTIASELYLYTDGNNGQDRYFTIGANSAIDQDVSKDSWPTFDGLTVAQADLTAGACTVNQVRIDTGGDDKELCICAAANTWYCITFTTTTGPTN